MVADGRSRLRLQVVVVETCRAMAPSERVAIPASLRTYAAPVGRSAAVGRPARSRRRSSRGAVRRDDEERRDEERPERERPEREGGARPGGTAGQRDEDPLRSAARTRRAPRAIAPIAKTQPSVPTTASGKTTGSSQASLDHVEHTVLLHGLEFAALRMASPVPIPATASYAL